MKTKKIVWYFLLPGVLVVSQGVTEETYEVSVSDEDKYDTEEDWPEVHPFDKDFESDLLNNNTDVELTLQRDPRRPVWNIAHMANNLYEVDFYLRQGANGIECDVTFKNDGEAAYTYHGFPCDCFRWCFSHETIQKYLDYMRQLTTPGNPRFKDQLMLIFLDLKLSSKTNLIAAGKDLAMKLLKFYWNHGKPDSGGRAYIINSMPSIDYADFVIGFEQAIREAGATHFLKRIGYDFSDNEDLDKIRSTYQRLKIRSKIVQADGITNCLPRSTERLKKAIRRRDQAGLTYIDKVYWWTVDKKSTMERVLELGVDGVMTNYPSNMGVVLEYGNIKKIARLATYKDNPFVKHIPMFAQLRAPQDETEEPEVLWNI